MGDIANNVWATTSKAERQKSQNYDTYLKRDTFHKWKRFCCEKQIEWKQSLRASIHRNFSLKRRYFIKWAKFMMASKSDALKEIISEIMFKRNQHKRIIWHIFSEWSRYTNQRKETMIRYGMAKEHYKSKYNPEYLRIYFQRWRTYLAISSQLKRKQDRADAFYSGKLKMNALTMLCMYIAHKRREHEAMSTAILHYQNKTKAMCFLKLQHYTLMMLRNNEKFQMVNCHYELQLKKRTLRKFKDYTNQTKMIKDKVEISTKMHEKHLKNSCLKQLQIYVHYRKQKALKCSKVVDYFMKNLKRKSFQKIKRYTEEKQARAIRCHNIVKQFDDKIIERQKRIHFTKWRLYVKNKQHKHNTYRRMFEIYNTKLKKRTWISWSNYVLYKIRKIGQKQYICSYNEKRLKANALKIWLEFSEEQKHFKAKIEQAKYLYRQNLIQEFFTLMFVSAQNLKAENINRYLSERKKNLEIAYKYFAKWKCRTIYKQGEMLRNTKKYSYINVVQHESISENKKTDSNYCSYKCRSLFKWDPRCLISPRIPKCMINKIPLDSFNF